MAIEQIIKDKLGLKEINALVKANNIASLKAFIINSFQLERTITINNEEYLEFKKLNYEYKS